ncbi:CRAL-TRIO domain-containing protein [Mycena indigotica]|uniref:Phosphatidylinositol transfer protein SFH5 n=1 Tax=Mycena indigotica TaxID=2126181 RepID=A0A8H6T0X8_9AGAR|nr:CRAL-TRIO domain-containing protein [Mycena indigotica]KAF7309950.1 CRAL-TRIO domain-containing protein [Mycena indigotica]
MSEANTHVPAAVEPTPAPTATATAVEATTTVPPTSTTTIASPPEPAQAAVPSPTDAPTVETEKKDKKVEEPQNALTEKFTGYEWKALTELRKTIPDALVKAYEKPEAKTTPIILWGVHIDPTNLVDAKVSVILMKFLRARQESKPNRCKRNVSFRVPSSLSTGITFSRFVETLRWRDEFKVDDACKEEFPEDVFGKLGHIYGRDKEGRPVVYNVYGGNSDIDAVFGDVDRFLRWRVAFMEKSLTLLDFATVDQCIQVHDYAGVNMSSRTPSSKAAASQASNIFSSHYPELLYKKFFVNVPGYMSWLFWIFKTILPAATFAKMSVVGSGPKPIGKALLPFIAPDQLPTQYGGTAEAEVFEKK